LEDSLKNETFLKSYLYGHNEKEVSGNVFGFFLENKSKTQWKGKSF